MEVIVGGIIEKDGKVLLVQEAKKQFYKKWSIPAGHLEYNETIMQGAIREIREETGCDVELTGIVNIANKVLEDDIVLTIIFSTKLLNIDSEYNKNEIYAVEWYNMDDVINSMDNELRDLNFVRQPIINYKKGNISSLGIINEL